jgi:hypothetical protein
MWVRVSVRVRRRLISSTREKTKFMGRRSKSIEARDTGGGCSAGGCTSKIKEKGLDAVGIDGFWMCII